MSDCLISNKLTLNIDKFNLLFFNMNNIWKANLDMQSGNEKLEAKEYAKYLGIYIEVSLFGRSKYKFVILNWIEE